MTNNYVAKQEVIKPQKPNSESPLLFFIRPQIPDLPGL